MYLIDYFHKNNIELNQTISSLDENFMPYDTVFKSDKLLYESYMRLLKHIASNDLYTEKVGRLNLEYEMMLTELALKLEDALAPLEDRLKSLDKDFSLDYSFSEQIVNICVTLNKGIDVVVVYIYISEALIRDIPALLVTGYKHSYEECLSKLSMDFNKIKGILNKKGFQ